jgi:hypothetical protein
MTALSTGQNSILRARRLRGACLILLLLCSGLIAATPASSPAPAGASSLYGSSIQGAPRLPAGLAQAVQLEQQQKLTAPDGAQGDTLGFSAALSADGVTALLGDIGASSFTGAAYVITAGPPAGIPTATSTPTLTATTTNTPLPSVWTTTGSMNFGRYSHTATLLPDGKVLVVGGEGPGGAQASTELYDPGTGAWTSTGSMNVARSQHTATLLPDGKVLVAGGVGQAGDLASAELYDPGTGTWTLTKTLNVERALHTATLLPSGRVLVAGGIGRRILAGAELY